ncbi:MAG TPA: LPXTG cell wall anchor domain-containing protein, partial [Marmoricola sp.]
SGPLECDILAGTLSCTGTLESGDTETVHITAPTAFASCGTYDNTASLTATNTPQAPTSSARTQVLCPDLVLSKTADAASVNAGGQIGFTVTASNSDESGVGTAVDVVIDDPLPAGTGVDWSIASGPENCTIQGAPPTETLHCAAVDLAPGDSLSVHVVSGTTTASCLAYPNVATLTADNAPTLTANATTSVANCVVVTPPVVSPPEVKPPAALPNTGGPNLWLLVAGFVLLLGGGTLLAGDRMRRRRS